ncbi:MAG TPA: hypothetical protein GX000_05960 [Actinomyces sp.]|nr:hypothetical protein [Actinomyces sp.]
MQSSNWDWDWAAVGSVSNAVAMGVAALFAYMAWKEQRSTSREERRRSATNRVSTFVDSFTTGNLSESRDILTTWNWPGRDREFDSGVEHPSYSKARKAAFDALWGLHRASMLSEDIKDVHASLRRILVHHLRLALSELTVFSLRIRDGDSVDSEATSEFGDSAESARDGLVNLASVLGDHDQEQGKSLTDNPSGLSRLAGQKE